MYEPEPTLFPEIATAAERRRAQRDPEPAFLYQSMGAGVQSTTIALLAANGVIPKPRYAVFSDTGWEPNRVYEHLERLNVEVLQPAGIELVKVSAGNLYTEGMDLNYPRMLPLYSRDPDTGAPRGLMSRACTSGFKLGPIWRWLREQLGGAVSVVECKYCLGTGERTAPWLAKDPRYPNTLGPCSVCRGTKQVTRVGQPPRTVWAQSMVGFSADELFRVGRSRVPYCEDSYPLIEGELAMTRDDCIAYLGEQGWGDTAKSSCIGCPFHNNAEWREVRDDPEQWAQAVAFDRAIRQQPAANMSMYLHKSRVPLEQADLSEPDDDAEAPSCSPYGCRSGDPIPLPTGDGELDFGEQFMVERGGEVIE